MSGDFSQLSLVCGDKTFSDFSITGAIDDANIRLSMDDSGLISINFGGSFISDTGTGNEDYQILYSVMTDGEWLISEIGQAMTVGHIGAGGIVSIAENVRVGGFGGNSVASSNLSFVGSGTCAGGANDCEDPVIEGDQLVLLDPFAPFDPLGQVKVWVTKDISVRAFGCLQPETAIASDSNCFNSIGPTIITQSFTQIPNGDIPEVPEPATMLLFSSALLGLGFMRRKKS